MVILEITIQGKQSDGWPIVADHTVPGDTLKVRSEGLLQLDVASANTESDPHKYGALLGRALFRDEVGSAFLRARALSEDRLYILLCVEDPVLRALHWERLCAPLDHGWDFIALDQRVPFSLYLPSRSDRRFPPITRADLQALIVAASPKDLEDYGLSHFDVEAAVGGAQAALAPIKADVLNYPVTLDALCERLTSEPYTLLHIILHGQSIPGDNDTVLFFAGDDGRVDPVRGRDMLKRLGRLRGARGLPQLAFLASCHSATPVLDGGLDGLAQRLVRDLGMPAVVAMAGSISVETATALCAGFYPRLREHGEVDRALTEAAAGLTSRYDITVPALYSRLGGRRLFSETQDPARLTPRVIEAGLTRLEGLVAVRAPVLRPAFEEQAATLRGMLWAEPGALSAAAQDERAAALNTINALCDEIADLTFPALALGQEPPSYDQRCPFRGLEPFRAEDHDFFFGRDTLVTQLLEHLERTSFLPIVGSSGSGKSSLVLAGLLPALQKRRPGLAPEVIRPGNAPAAQLDAALARLHGERPVLVVDQFEELFTLCRDEDQRLTFIKGLLDAIPSVSVILTMRADFWGACAPYRPLVDRMIRDQELIAPLTAAELRGAIERQAHAVNLCFEADIGGAIVDFVRGAPGAMPLVQHALRRLWLHRHGRWLLASELRAIGGVEGAIAVTADTLYEELSGDDQRRMLDIFARLTLGEARTDPDGSSRNMRRRATVAELASVGDDAQAVHTLVARIADERLLVTSVNALTGAGEVEVAHEALLNQWPRLIAWLEEHKAILSVRASVDEAARAWDMRGRDPDLLIHQGRRLDEALVVLRDQRFGANERERDYLAACLAKQGLVPINLADLRALLLVASPDDGPGRERTVQAVAAAAQARREAFGLIPADVLSPFDGSRAPSMEALVATLGEQQYGIVHILCTGRIDPASAEPLLLLAESGGARETGRVSASRLVERLGALPRSSRLPRLIFLETWDSEEGEAQPAMEGLARELDAGLGIPVVITGSGGDAASRASIVRRFYHQLFREGSVAQALRAAASAAQERSLPQLSVQARQTSPQALRLFEMAVERPLTDAELARGLAFVRECLAERAPVLLPRLPAAATAEASQQDKLAQIDELCAEVLGIPFAGLALGQSVPPFDARCPYPGPRPFDEEDADRFFGREEVLAALLARLRETPVVVLTGASGCGKTSLIRAGLLAALRAGALRAGGWPVAVWTPEGRTLEGFAAALTSLAPRPGQAPGELWPRGLPVDEARLRRLLVAIVDGLSPDQQALVIVDQFERLFTSCDQEERRLIMHTLFSAARERPPRLALVIVLRSSSYEDFVAHPELDIQPARANFVLGPADKTVLRAMIEQPARMRGYTFDAGLVERLLSEVEGQPGGVPLLQMALVELWRRRHGPHLGTKEYEALGGIGTLVCSLADEIFSQLAPQDQARVMAILTRLVRLEAGQMGPPGLRQVCFDELVTNGSDEREIAALIERLADRRLVVIDADTVLRGGFEHTSQTTVTLAHSALASDWKPLSHWLSEGYVQLLLRDRVTEAARDWREQRRDESRLIHRGKLLEDALGLVSLPGGLNRFEQDYLDACGALERRERGTRRSAGWLRRLAWGAALIALALVAGLLALPMIARGEMAAFDGGGFIVGSEEPGALQEEGPVWEAAVAPFRLERHEVTNHQYWMCVLALACDEPREPEPYRTRGRSGHPVVNVSAQQAAAFCSWLGRRLPSELEWEWAARGGAALRPWPWGAAPPDKSLLNVQFAADDVTELQPAVSYPSGATPDTGILNLAGNAMEWTATPEQGYPYPPDEPEASWSNEPDAAPPSLIVRGGSFRNDLRYARPTARLGARPEAFRNDLGFRCAESVPAEP